jgi:hypothetical protein
VGPGIHLTSVTVLSGIVVISDITLVEVDAPVSVIWSMMVWIGTGWQAIVTACSQETEWDEMGVGSKPGLNAITILEGGL